MAQSALRCSVVDFSTVASGSVLADLGLFGADGAGLFAATGCAGICVFGWSVGGGCSRRATAEVRRGCTKATWRCGSHAGRLRAAVKLHRGHSNAARGSNRGIMAAAYADGSIVGGDRLGSSGGALAGSFDVAGGRAEELPQDRSWRRRLLGQIQKEEIVQEEDQSVARNSERVRAGQLKL